MDIKKKSKKIAITIAILILACITILVCHFPRNDHSGSVIIFIEPEHTEPELHGLYDVVRVVDGDTIIVSIEGTDTRVRMIGVDTPESVNPDASKNTENGKIASEWTSKLLTGKQVYLEYDIEKKDKYDRTLAYVFLSDKVTMVEDELLRNGMAEVMTIEPNSKYAAHFEELENQAKRNRIGFWN